jgi:hypothetical protein
LLRTAATRKTEAIPPNDTAKMAKNPASAQLPCVTRTKAITPVPTPTAKNGSRNRTRHPNPRLERDVCTTSNVGTTGLGVKEAKEETVGVGYCSTADRLRIASYVLAYLSVA